MSKMTMAMFRPTLDDIIGEIENILKNSPDTEVRVRMVDNHFELSFDADPVEALGMLGVNVRE